MCLLPSAVARRGAAPTAIGPIAAPRYRYPGIAALVSLPKAGRTNFWEDRSEEHTSELQSLMRISYAVFCLKKKNITKAINTYKTVLEDYTPYNYTNDNIYN